MTPDLLALRNQLRALCGAEPAFTEKLALAKTHFDAGVTCLQLHRERLAAVQGHDEEHNPKLPAA